MTARQPVPAMRTVATASTTDVLGILTRPTNDILADCDRRVAEEQAAREGSERLDRLEAERVQLVADIRALRTAELALDNDCARSAAAAYARVLREMGEDL